MSGLEKNTRKNADSVEETRKKLAEEYGWNDEHPRLPNIMVPKELWLQPWCQDCEENYLSGLGDRYWSEANHGDCECGAKPTHYVLAKSKKGTK